MENNFYLNMENKNYLNMENNFYLNMENKNYLNMENKNYLNNNRYDYDLNNNKVNTTIVQSKRQNLNTNISNNKLNFSDKRILDFRKNSRLMLPCDFLTLDKRKMILACGDGYGHGYQKKIDLIKYNNEGFNIYCCSPDYNVNGLRLNIEYLKSKFDLNIILCLFDIYDTTHLNKLVELFHNSINYITTDDFAYNIPMIYSYQLLSKEGLIDQIDIRNKTYLNLGYTKELMNGLFEHKNDRLYKKMKTRDELNIENKRRRRLYKKKQLLLESKKSSNTLKSSCPFYRTNNIFSKNTINKELKMSSENCNTNDISSKSSKPHRNISFPKKNSSSSYSFNDNFF